MEQAPDDLLALDRALAKLAQEDALCAELVKLRFFAGLTDGIHWRQIDVRADYFCFLTISRFCAASA